MGSKIDYSGNYRTRKNGFIWLIKNKSTKSLILSILKIVILRIKNFSGFVYYKLFKSGRTFLFNNSKYTYLIHQYNRAFAIERTVEIPIVEKKLDDYFGCKILEVGNVMQNYIKSSHDVVDLFEIGKNVHNVDIVDYVPVQKYNLIVSVSTIEHIGLDDLSENPQKVSLAIEHLKKLLLKDGELFFTFPLGYNEYLDKLVFSKNSGLTKSFLMKRISVDNKWEQMNFNDIRRKKDSFVYGKPYEAGNYIFIGVYIK